MATDEDLITAVANGDGRALEELCRRYERGLHQFIFRHTGGRDVDDLYQETWLRVVRAARRFDPRGASRPGSSRSRSTSVATGTAGRRPSPSTPRASRTAGRDR